MNFFVNVYFALEKLLAWYYTGGVSVLYFQFDTLRQAAWSHELYIVNDKTKRLYGQISYHVLQAIWYN